MNFSKTFGLVAFTLLMSIVFGCTADDDSNISVDATGCLVLINGEFINTPVTKRPVYLDGGDDGFLRTIYKNLKYPAIARENGIQGQVKIEYEITEMGRVENIIIIKDVGGGLAQEAARAIETSTLGVSYSPAEIDNVKYRVKKVLPVKFRLE